MDIDLEIFDIQDNIIRLQSNIIKELCLLLRLENDTPKDMKLLKFELEEYRKKQGGGLID